MYSEATGAAGQACVGLGLVTKILGRQGGHIILLPPWRPGVLRFSGSRNFLVHISNGWIVPTGLLTSG